MEETFTAEEFAAWRAAMGINQTEAARLLGYSNRSRVCQMERGHTPVPVRVAMLCRRLKPKRKKK